MTEQSLYFVAALIAILMIIGFIIDKVFISPVKDTVVHLINEFTKLGIKIAKKCIQITETDIEAFDTEEDYINFLTSIVTDEFTKQLKELGLYNKAKKYFDNDELSKFIKFLFENYKDELKIPSFNNNAIESLDDNDLQEDNTIDIKEEKELARDEIAELYKEPPLTEETDV